MSVMCVVCEPQESIFTTFRHMTSSLFMYQLFVPAAFEEEEYVEHCGAAYVPAHSVQLEFPLLHSRVLWSDM